jgi:cold-inducible RNA-binding protein
MSFDVTEEEIRHEFEAYGDVTSIILVKNWSDGSSRGYAFVEMLRALEGYAAIHSLNGKILKERAIVVTAARNWTEFGNNRPRNGSRFAAKKRNLT